MNKLICLFFGVSLVVFHTAPACPIEKLSDFEMQAVTAQAGISFRTDSVSIFHRQQGRTLTDINTVDRFGTSLSPKGYVTFDLSSMMIVNNFIRMDIGVFNQEESLTFTDETSSGSVERSFSHPLNNMAMLRLATREASENPEYLIQMNEMAVYNHDLAQENMLGDLNISDVRMAATRLDLFPPNAQYGCCGIRGVAGMRSEVDSLELENPDQQMTARATGVMIGSAFTGDPLPEGGSSSNEIDTSTWAFADGVFELGIPYYYHDDPDQEDTELDTHPFAIDFNTDENRSGNFPSYIAINAPMRGSIRVKDISSDNFNMGPIAIDGIRLYKNVVEFPGRGIGN